MDILLGADYHELMYLMKEIVGEQGQPSARLCPLGWTAVGKVDGLAKASSYYTGRHHMFQLSTNQLQSEHYREDRNLHLDEMLKKFWDLDSLGITQKESAELEM